MMYPKRRFGLRDEGVSISGQRAFSAFFRSSHGIGRYKNPIKKFMKGLPYLMKKGLITGVMSLYIPGRSTMR
jgi:hypothetical protein